LVLSLSLTAVPEEPAQPLSPLQQRFKSVQ
jgi:hypothetical protein